MTNLVKRLRDLICDGDLCVSECSCKLALKAAAELERFAARVAELEADLARISADRQRELDECPYCRHHIAGGVGPCYLHGGCASAVVEKLPDGQFRFVCPVCGRPSEKDEKLLRARIAELEQERLHFEHTLTTHYVAMKGVKE